MTILKQFSGKVYPDLTFSIGAVPKATIRASDKQYDRDYREQFDSYSIAEYDYNGYKCTTEQWLDGRVKLNRFIKSPKLSRRPKRYGYQGITGNGKRIVKNCAVVMEKEHGIKKLGFVTCTVPPTDDFANSIICANWGEIIRQFFQRIRRRLIKIGGSDDMVAVTEIQEKRYRRTGTVVPHLHFLYVCRKRAHDRTFYISANELRLWWNESINNVLKANGCLLIDYAKFGASVDCQVVKKSAASYLGKYISKGGEVVREIVESGNGHLLPHQWWTASTSVKKKFRAAIIHLDDKFCSFVFFNLGDCLADEWFSWVSYVDILIGDDYCCVGCVGVLTTKTYELLHT